MSHAMCCSWHRRCGVSESHLFLLICCSISTSYWVLRFVMSASERRLPLPDTLQAIVCDAYCEYQYLGNLAVSDAVAAHESSADEWLRECRTAALVVCSCGVMAGVQSAQWCSIMGHKDCVVTSGQVCRMLLSSYDISVDVTSIVVPTVDETTAWLLTAFIYGQLLIGCIWRCSNILVSYYMTEVCVCCTIWHAAPVIWFTPWTQQMSGYLSELIWHCSEDTRTAGRDISIYTGHKKKI